MVGRGLTVERRPAALDRPPDIGLNASHSVFDTMVPGGRFTPWHGLAAAVALSVVVTPPAVRSHAIESTLMHLADLQDDWPEQENGLTISSRFSTGEPATDAVVRLLPPDGSEPVEVGRTDASGSLSFTLPSQLDGTWEIQVDGGPGHRDYLEMPVREARPRPDEVVLQAPSPWRPAPAPTGLALLLGGVLSGAVVSLRRR
ncbi:hypothetical protein EVJ50_00615 [Synechococcus sp. RSCCF101]|uniref:hypothetical protein n=1 Tax=Synechococcus sp. RSCCF101 TaxID=2511069 RepID=UPI0012454DFE|nr:hypothetical protein [Synechococcus sp. RSCCF101]QEY30976.1 hypothetical protein EVJ50_00615 [Synechococcus sp. RSCCF101]